MRIIIGGVEETEGGHLVNPDIDSPDIDGGTIDGAIIGGTTPMAGSFTQLNVVCNNDAVVCNNDEVIFN